MTTYRWSVFRYLVCPLLFLLAIAGMALIPSSSAPALAASCSGGPTIDGITLDECVDRTFTIGSNSRAVRVWYTKNQTTANRTVDGNTLTLSHWITADNQAAAVAQAAEAAWRRYFTDSGHEPYLNGCSRLNIQLEDGVGWSGIAYWSASGHCSIGIDAPMIANGVTTGDQAVVAHEVQHYLQYSYDSGCYGDLRPNYPGNSWFVEGYADLGMDTVSAAIDAIGFSGNAYDPTTSMYKKSYGNRFDKYLIEQLGTVGIPSDPNHHIDAMYNHYQSCDAADQTSVLDTLIPSLSGAARTEKQFFTDFFAANWAFPWTSAASQPQLFYSDNDGTWTGPTLRQDVSMSGGAQSWSDTTPDLWAARYYQIRPQSGCPYIELAVDGAPGAQLGINLMAARTTTPREILRSSAIGEDFTRTFAAQGSHDRLVVAVNSFNHNYNYTVRATCVTPVLEILEPRQTNFALVGTPSSPLAFLARFRVTSGSNAIQGLPASAFSFDAEGSAATISTSPGAFQQVGGEYWAVLQAPTKPAGTSFVDLRACLDGSICDSETNALLYVTPGSTDTALVFDASGSMNTEDTVGEGTRLSNARKAGKVIADLLRPGDRILVTDFSAFNSPPGCGLPSGSGNCALDIQVKLGRTAVTGPATITAANAAIDTIGAREWTPIGAAIVDAKDRLLAAPYSLNPKHIHLLSDGQENVNPLWSAIRANVVASGVIVNTIGLGPEAPGALLAQIAAATGGRYRPVATSGAGAMLTATTAERTAQLTALGADPALISVMAAPVQPGQLGLADVYDDFDTSAQSAARILHAAYSTVPSGESRELSTIVDSSVTQLRVVVAGKQADSTGCEGYHRDVELLPPGYDPQGRWFPISPRDATTPAAWDIRNNMYDDTVIIANPAAGSWRIRTRYYYLICSAGIDVAPQALESDFMMNVSVQSTVQLTGRLLNLSAGQANAGDQVPIVGILLNRAGTIPGALMVAAVESPKGTDYLTLKDDGNNRDGAAGDGIYGAIYGATTVGGSYGVRIVALLPNPAAPSQALFREWNGGFWINGPASSDSDGDGMPNAWERRCGLNPYKPDGEGDLDRDGLTNWQEFQIGTLPCRSDTDNGGERDGSEVNGGRNPLDRSDDSVCAIGIVNTRALNQRAMIQWPKRPCFSQVRLYLSERPDELGQAFVLDQSEITIPSLVNNRTYYVTLETLFGNATGDFSEQYTVTPKEDPDPPSGAILIESRAGKVRSRNVMLRISSSDQPLEGAAEGANAHLTDRLSNQLNSVTGQVQMRISNDVTMAGASWEPLAQSKAWTLACQGGQTCTVYAQFRDGAGNQSLIVRDAVALENTGLLYIPIINR